MTERLRRSFILCITVILAFSLTGCQSSNLAQELEDISRALEKAGPLPTVTPEPTINPKATAKPSPTPRPSPTPERKAFEPIALPTSTPWASPGVSETPKPAETAKPTPTPSPTVKPTPVPSATPEPTPTPYPASMYAPTPGSIPYMSPTPEPTPAPVVSTETPAATEKPKGYGFSAMSMAGDAAEHSATYDKGVELALFAMSYVGSKYTWGGESPEEGFDCSGLVYYVYGIYGYSMNRTAAEQTKNGTWVAPDALEPGDVLCFHNGSSINHAGIYIGGGEYVHAQDSATGVVVGAISDRGGSFQARRILQ